MRINANGLYPTRGSTDLTTDARPSAPPAATPAGQDTVTLSPRAQLVAAARNALGRTPATRPEVVAEARGRVVAGGSWDSRELAAAMIRTVAENSA